MAEVKKRREPIPEDFDTIEDFWEFWDNKSLADYDDYLREVEFDLDIKSE